MSVELPPLPFRHFLFCKIIISDQKKGKNLYIYFEALLISLLEEIEKQKCADCSGGTTDV